ncbi:MAG: hypothetical protein Fur0037_08060 [Planctomycetota bacterium]
MIRRPVLLLFLCGLAAACQTAHRAPAPGRTARPGAFRGGPDLDERARVERLYSEALDSAGDSTLASRGLVSASAKEPPPPPREQPPEQMMTYRGAMTLEVARAKEAIAKFLARVAEWKGYLGAQQDRRITVRLPSARFDEAMAALRSLGRVLSESRKVDDVTRHYLDLGIRIENARKGRERLLALLEKAAKVEDMLAIEEQLRRLTEEIERMEGEIKYLADRVAMATIEAEFRGAGPAEPASRRRPSRFSWINDAGIENLLEVF